jgi:hypothetical protein
MAEGFRVTEDGSLRVTESLDPRITQNYAPLYADSTLTAVGTQIFVAGILLGASSEMTGALSEMSASTFTAGAVSEMTASGSVDAEATWYKNFIASLSGSGDISALLGYQYEASAEVSSVASITLQPNVIRDVDSSLNASLSYDVVPSLTLNPEADIQTEGYFVSTPSFIASGQFNGQSAGTLGAVGEYTTRASSSLQASTDFLIYPLLIQAAASLVGGTGSVTAYGGFLANGEADLSANGILNGNMIMIQNAIVTSEPLRRVTESGDPRIISTGEFRSAFGESNMIDSIMSPVSTLIPFDGQIFGHRGGEYKPVFPRVKRNGVWVTPTVYVKNNGTWKRVY